MFWGFLLNANSYQNAIGSARKVVRLVKGLDMEASTQAELSKSS